MSAVAHYLAMGGYAVFVWPAYGLAVAILGGLSLHTWQRYRTSVRTLDEVERRARK